MLHGISVFDFINNIDDIYHNEQHADKFTDNNNTLLANTTSIQDDISPVGIRKALSTAISNGPATQKGKYVTIDNTTVTIDDLNIDSVAHTQYITYLYINTKPVIC